MKVERIDHVHVEVADRDVAADWYARVLGLTRAADLKAWADDPMGPLILNAADGHPALSLFARDAKPPSRDTTIAFRVDGMSFLQFRDALRDLDLRDREGNPVKTESVADHDLSWSIYFVDPDGNRLEVTTYDYAQVAGAL